MTLWSLAQSPLIYGGDLRDNNQSDWDVITNPSVLDVQVCTLCLVFHARGDGLAVICCWG